jgi:hypothetical protein
MLTRLAPRSLSELSRIQDMSVGTMNRRSMRGNTIGIDLKKFGFVVETMPDSEKTVPG